MAKPLNVMFSAGESSGEQHAAHMFLELKKRYPNSHAFGMGGAAMREAGIDVCFDSSSIAVIGVVEILKHYREIQHALKLMQQLLVERKPDLLVCVDYKEFNFKLARFAKRCGIKVLFYVSPQVWAWRPGRVKKYGRVIDMMAVIFPFETAYYEAENIPVSYVGHPSVDKVQPLFSTAENLKRFELDDENPIVGLLPGSRIQEIERMLPVMLEAALLIQRQFPAVQFLLPQAQSISDTTLSRYLAQSSVPVQVIKNQPYDVIECCDVVMTTSGTATLEIALLQIPMVIVYKLFSLTYWLGRLLVKTPFIGLPNIVFGKSIIRELIQDDASSDKIAGEVIRILSDSDYRQNMKTNLAEVKTLLGSDGGSKNMAKLVLKMLGLQSLRSKIHNAK